MTNEATTLPVHSRLGASSAERWMECPGSNLLLDKLGFREDTDEADYQKLGTAAHDLVAHCLTNIYQGNSAGREAWEFMGTAMCNDVVVDTEMADAVQVYLNECEGLLDGAVRVFIEERISSPLSEYFYGTVDFAAIASDGTTLRVRDYKHGQGVVVDVEWNPQFLYYAWGIVEKLPDIQTIDIGVVQPRAYHPDGPIRTWAISRADLAAWVANELVPAMDAAQVDKRLKAGDWCRFCPAKLICPMLTGLFKAAANVDLDDVLRWDDATLGQHFDLVQAVEMRIKAIKDEVFARLMKGRECEGAKLVLKRANRVWRPEAREKLMEAVGQGLLSRADLYTTPEIKSPATLEKVGGPITTLVKKLAYTPDNGFTVARQDDKRAAVKVRPMEERFKNFREAA